MSTSIEQGQVLTLTDLGITIDQPNDQPLNDQPLTLADLGIQGQGQLLSIPFDLSDRLRVFTFSQVVAPSQTRQGFIATNIALQCKTARGFYTFYLPYSKKNVLRSVLNLL